MAVGIKAAAAITAASFMAIGPILVTLSKVPDPERNVTAEPEETYIFEYSVPVSTMVTEFLKLSLSSVLLLSTRLRASDDANAAEPLLHAGSGAEFVRFMLPAFIYFVNNNLIFFILLAVDPITFQLLSQIKTIFTALLFRVFLGRRLSAVQYTALVTLACGTATAQVPSGGTAVRPSAWWGLLLSVVSALLSSLGGIYSEKLLKGRKVSLHWQNVQLYLWGVAFNAIGAYMKDGAALRDRGLLAGFGRWAWAVVLCNGLAGLAISAVLKFADNIARVYAHAVAMIATMLLSVELFGAAVTPQLLLGMTLVANSTFQYHAKTTVAAPPLAKLESRHATEMEMEPADPRRDHADSAAYDDARCPPGTPELSSRSGETSRLKASEP